MNPESNRWLRMGWTRPRLVFMAIIVVAILITAPAAMAALATPSPLATAAPTAAPTQAPTAAPTAAPTPAPTAAPTPAPTAAPTPAPTAAPTLAPTPAPTAVPTLAPTAAPTPVPTLAPTPVPTPVATPIPPLPKPAVTGGLTTRVSVEIPTGSVIGKDVVVVAILKDRFGTPVPSQHLSLFLDGQEIHSALTDTNGQVSFTVQGKKLEQARNYAVGVLFGGSHGWAGSTAKDTLTILTAAIQIVTVPPLPGLRFTLGSASALTGPDGVAALPVPQSGIYQLSSDLNGSSVDPSIRASFVRWLDDVFTANRTVDIVGPATYTIGLRVAYRAAVNFVDLSNQPVDPTLVEQAQFSNGTGADDVVLNQQTGATDVWWTASTTIRAGGQLVVSPITYRALSVQIHGAEVINRGQQSWTPAENATWTIQVLLYGMTVQTRDALFGSPVSGRLQLTYPDGYVTTQAIGSNGTVNFYNLPRGQYQLKLASSAFTPPTPVALSKPQDATLRVITMTDIGLAAGLLLGVTLLLGLIGRWSLIWGRGRRKAARRALGGPAPIDEPATIDEPAVAGEPTT